MFSFFNCNKKSKKTSNAIVESETLRFFGAITLSNARDYEVDNIKINDNIVSIDINFEEDKIHPKTIKSIRNILNNIEAIEKAIKEEIHAKVNQDGMVKEYFEFHAEEIDAQDLKMYLKDTDQNLTTELQLLSKLKLKRLGFFPDATNFFAIFDYRVASELSDDILVVCLNNKGEIIKFTVES